MNYCTDCGSSVSLQFIVGDHRKRYVCSGCGMTHYDNPRVLVATYVCSGDKILWIQRGIEPARGLWAIPGGFMEKGETPEEAASRELWEETGISTVSDQMTLVSVSSILHMAQLHLVFRCHLDDMPEGIKTQEAANLDWFSQNEAPWAKLAFQTIKPQIRQMYSWLATGKYGIRVGMVDESGSHYKNYPLAQ